MSNVIELPHPTALKIPVEGGAFVSADLTVPREPCGVVLFVHGSGSSRHSPRNRYVASSLNHRQMATVLADLLTPEEAAADERSGAFRFDIELLTNRVVEMLGWVRTWEVVSTAPVGLFGASTGAAAALDAAALRPREVRAVVSRGGRPDLATRLEMVRAPTLLLVGGNDGPVIELNNGAMRRLRCHAELEIISGASHLFEEPGTLEAAASAAGVWFRKYLTANPKAEQGDGPCAFRT